MRIPKFILLIALIFGSASVFPQDSTNSSDKKVTSLRKLPNHKRPNSPSRSYIVCTYGKGFMNFSFIGGIDNVYARIFNDERTFWNGYVSSTYPSVILPELSGVYQIECTDEYDNVFSGMLYFD